MNIQVDFWQLVTLAFAIVTAFWALTTLLIKQFDKGLDQRFDAQDRARKEANDAIAKRLTDLEGENLAGRVASVEERARDWQQQTATVNAMSGDIKAVQAELRGINSAIAPLTRGVDRINDYLLTHK